MLMDIIAIDLFDQNMSMACAKVRLRYSWISLILIYLINLWVWTQMLMDITGIDLFNKNVGMACAKVRLICSWISPVLIYLINM